MNARLAAWNAANVTDAQEAMLACCGAPRWAAAMVALRPFADVAELSAAADREWSKVDEADWLQAFACHPRIGDRKAAHASEKSSQWSRQEQSSVGEADKLVTMELATANAAYELRHGFTYIVCATGKSSEEMLAILKRRLYNDRTAELREAAEQQRQIMQLRIGKWLVE